MWHCVHDIVVLSVVFIIRQDPVVYTQELLGSGHVYLEGRLVVGQAVEILLMWYCGGDIELLQSWPLNQLIWCPLTWGQPQLHWLRPQVHALYLCIDMYTTSTCVDIMHGSCLVLAYLPALLLFSLIIMSCTFVWALEWKLVILHMWVGNRMKTDTK